MKNRNNILDELKEVAPTLANLAQSDAYSVPENYFSSLQSKIFTKIKEEEVWEKASDPALSPQLQLLKGKKHFSLPENYFANTTANILSTIRKEEVVQELQALAPQLATLQKHNAFSVPQNYFSTLPKRILAEVSKQNSAAAKEVLPSFWDNLNAQIDVILVAIFKPQLRVAFASLVAVGVAFWFLNNTKPTEQNPVASLNGELNRMSTTEISNYVAMHIDDYDEATLKKRAGDVNGMSFFNDSELNDNELEQILQREMEEELFLDSPTRKAKNQLI